jgi:hypothetical protein
MAAQPSGVLHISAESRGASYVSGARPCPMARLPILSQGDALRGSDVAPAQGPAVSQPVSSPTGTREDTHS